MSPAQHVIEVTPLVTQKGFSVCKHQDFTLTTTRPIRAVVNKLMELRVPLTDLVELRFSGAMVVGPVRLDSLADGLRD